LGPPCGSALTHVLAFSLCWSCCDIAESRAYVATQSPLDHDAEFYKERNTVERLINKLKAWRGIATRYGKTPESYLAGLRLRASVIWIKDLTRTRPGGRAGHRGA
jgi:hypothetical protein